MEKKLGKRNGEKSPFGKSVDKMKAISVIRVVKSGFVKM